MTNNVSSVRWIELMNEGKTDSCSQWHLLANVNEGEGVDFDGDDDSEGEGVAARQ